MRGALILLGLVAGLLVGSLATPSVVHAQPDSVRAAILEAKGYPPDHSPRGALWRSVAVPGWGQFYNRQFLKIPFVYGGLAGGGFFIHMTHQNYTLYRGAAIFRRGQALSQRGEEVPDVISDWEDYRGDYEEVQRRFGGEVGGQQIPERQLREARDKYRRWRDLSIVGTGVFYALTILDAYVSAHLLSFNVGEDLALDFRPVGQQRRSRPPSLFGTAIGENVPISPGFHVRLRFR